jgi:DHA2 family multidrug resistance protein
LWGGDAGASVVTAREQLWHLAYREASTLAFADAFRAIMLAFLVATLLVPLMRKARPRSPLPLLRPTNGSDADT